MHRNCINTVHFSVELYHSFPILYVGDFVYNLDFMHFLHEIAKSIKMEYPSSFVMQYYEIKTIYHNPHHIKRQGQQDPTIMCHHFVCGPVKDIPLTTNICYWVHFHVLYSCHGSNTLVTRRKLYLYFVADQLLHMPGG